MRVVSTSCCSTASERPHRCCHLPNKVENIDCMPNISYTLQWAEICPECFDAVGWVAERAPACKKLEWWGTGMVTCLEQDADLHMAQLMPLPLTVSCFSNIQIVLPIVLPFWYRLTRVVPEKWPLNRCVCVLQWAEIRPPKIALSPDAIRALPNTWFLGST